MPQKWLQWYSQNKTKKVTPTVQEKKKLKIEIKQNGLSSMEFPYLNRWSSDLEIGWAVEIEYAVRYGGARGGYEIGYW